MADQKHAKHFIASHHAYYMYVLLTLVGQRILYMYHSYLLAITTTIYVLLTLVGPYIYVVVNLDTQLV